MATPIVWKRLESEVYERGWRAAQGRFSVLVLRNHSGDWHWYPLENGIQRPHADSLLTLTFQRAKQQGAAWLRRCCEGVA